ncbi:hypothetical protein TUM19329_28450 [Legionella antarctica]|uniref:Uncharacterized protein n=1 Tax=Legionella antarctica TaxID=2708020 RepID=A0A6F8T726_9GAMM|nr:hypothetical protein TUM19329_28450 [Legionella antarctica]
MIKNAMKNAEMAISWGDKTPKKRNTGSSKEAKAGSPIQPNPKDAKVIPNWQADKYASNWLWTCSKICPLIPYCSLIACTRVVLSFTMLNSAATKNAFSKTNIIAKKINRKLYI